jgi:signal transduction histidine kinase
MDFVKHYQSLTHPPLPKIEEVHIYPFIQKILSLIKPECEENDVSIYLNVAEDSRISFDPQLIEQVIINLIRNSIQAFEGIDTKREIRVSACIDGLTGTQISVKDNGCGIDTDNMDNIFIPFYTTREKGSGIGLSFAKQIMRLHGGQISVRSDINRGAEFILRF